MVQQLKMSGRVYNAMMKFANGIKTAPQLSDMFFANGKIYTTDSFAMCCWTPAEKWEILDNTTGEKIESFFFTPRMDKVSAGSTIYIDSTAVDIDRKSLIPCNLDKIMNGSYDKHPMDIVTGIDPDYLAAIAALGKAVRTDRRDFAVSVDLDWAQHVLHAHIDAGKNGYFDIVVMPQIDKNKLKKEQ